MALRAVSGRWTGLVRPSCGRAGVALSPTKRVVARLQSEPGEDWARSGRRGQLLGLSHALALIDLDDGG